MSRTFRRHGDAIRMELEEFEVQLLRRMRDGLQQLLDGADPQDTVIRRLFPAAVEGDSDADAELRRLIHDDLLAARLSNLDAVLAMLGRAERHRGRFRVDLRDDEPMLLLGVLNDMRLALGARVGVEGLDREAINEADPLAGTLAVMDHFAWWQEQLLAMVDPEPVRHYDA